MTDPNLSFFARLPVAFGAFFAILSNGEFAARVRRLRAGPAMAEEAKPAPAPVEVATPALKDARPESALQLLGLLQREARFIDFIEEDVSAYSDADVGAAARVVHEGCRKALHEHFTIAPVRQETEGAPITLESGFDSTLVKITGNVVGQPPFRGSLSHRGWRVTDIRLPKLATNHDTTVLAPAEVEL